MAKSTTDKSKANCHLLAGDSFLVEKAANALAERLVPAAERDFGLEVVNGNSTNSEDAGKAISQTIVGLNTLPFFGGNKLVWLKGCNFLGSSVTSGTKEVTEKLADLAALLAEGLSPGIGLLISAEDVDQRKSFFKTFQKLGNVEVFEAVDETKKGWQEDIHPLLDAMLSELGKELDTDARALLLELVGGNLGMLRNELDKLSLYVGERRNISVEDVALMVSATREAVFWQLGDAVADRNLSLALKLTRQLLGQGENAIGLLFSLINKVRLLLIMRELLNQKMIRVERDYRRMQDQIKQASEKYADRLPKEKKNNPLLQHPFVVTRLVAQAEKFSLNELIAGMDLLLETNQQLVSSGLNDHFLMEKALIKLLSARETRVAMEV